MQKISLLLLSLVTLKSQAAEWNHKQQGADWQGLCKTGTHQSPVDLPAYIPFLPYRWHIYANFGLADNVAVDYDNSHFLQVKYDT